LKFSAEPTPRPPETTRLRAVCRSGRSRLALLQAGPKRVCEGQATSTLAASMAGAPPPPAAAAQEAVRTVATTVCPAGALTVTMALPA
jgi:hypothetical protein